MLENNSEDEKDNQRVWGTYLILFIHISSSNVTGQGTRHLVAGTLQLLVRGPASSSLLH